MFDAEERNYMIIDNIVYNLNGMIEYLFVSENSHSKNVKIFSDDQNRFNRAVAILQLLQFLPDWETNNVWIEFSLVTGVFADYYPIFRTAFLETCENSVEEILREQSEWEFSGINYNDVDSECGSNDISDIFDDDVMIVPDIYSGRFSAPRPVY